MAHVIRGGVHTACSQAATEEDGVIRGHANVPTVQALVCCSIN